MDGKSSTFQPLGPAVGKAKLGNDDSTAWTLTATTYGTNILGIADLDQSAYHTVSEVRGKMVEVVDPALAKFKSKKGLQMVNLLSGAEMPIDETSAQRQTQNGLLVWTPSTRPKSACLSHPNFRRLATWVEPVPVANAAPIQPSLAKKTSGKPVVAVKTKSKSSTKSKTTAKPQGATQRKPFPSKAKKKAPQPKFKVEVTSRPSKKTKG